MLIATITKITTIGLLGEGGVGTGACSPEYFEKMVHFKCILKCILIKYQGKNNLKISVFIATTMKKSCGFVRRGEFW